MEFRDHPFWDFSLAVWGREAVEPACLALQARHGIDINVLLFCGWAGRRGPDHREPVEARRLC